MVGHVGQSGHRITSLWPKNEGIVVVPLHPFAVQAQDVLARGLAHAPQRGDIPRQPAEVVMPAK